MRPSLWVNTARHLSPGQAWAWARQQLTDTTSRGLDLKATSARRGAAWEELARRSRRIDSSAGPMATSRNRAEEVVDGQFHFVGARRRLDAIDWSAEYVSPLWTYHLRYLGFAVDLAATWRQTGEERCKKAFVRLWTSWLDAAEAGGILLEPYPTSVRCMNALRSLWLIEEELSVDFADRLLAATHAQLDWLERNLERHLRANHLQKNLTALAWGSLAFAGESAARWARYRAELWDEMREQVLPDGGHFERSPMYHAHALDDLLRTLAFCRAAGIDTPAELPGRLAAMTRALQWLSRPDGTLHLFNDSANGQDAGRDDVLALARRVLASEFPAPAGSFALPESGYFGHVAADGGSRLVIDAGPPGPDYQPGHAHCDMLSFELDLAGRPVIVDAGVHGYDGDPYREYVRSTRAHNTVSIDGRDQHEMWATFRVARRGEIVEVHPDETSGEGVYTFRGACRPYHDRSAVHHRLVELGENAFAVSDRVAGAAGRPVSSWLHLHPDLRVDRAGDESPGEAEAFVLMAEDSPLRVRIMANGADDIVVHRAECDPVQGWHCPKFGIALPAAAIELRIRSNDGRSFGWRVRCL